MPWLVGSAFAGHSDDQLPARVWGNSLIVYPVCFLIGRAGVIGCFASAMTAIGEACHARMGKFPHCVPRLLSDRPRRRDRMLCLCHDSHRRGVPRLANGCHGRGGALRSGARFCAQALDLKASKCRYECSRARSAAHRHSTRTWPAICFGARGAGAPHAAVSLDRAAKFLGELRTREHSDEPTWGVPWGTARRRQLRRRRAGPQGLHGMTASRKAEGALAEDKLGIRLGKRVELPDARSGPQGPASRHLRHALPGRLPRYSGEYCRMQYRRLGALPFSAEVILEVCDLTLKLSKQVTGWSPA
jgi:hypothetical protein